MDPNVHSNTSTRLVPPEPAPATPGKRYVLLARAEMDGAIRDPGYIFTLPEGKRGPHRGVVESWHGAGGLGMFYDQPLYSEIDEDHFRETEELRARQKREMDDLDGTTERNALLEKHAQESAGLQAKGAQIELERRQQAQADELKRRQAAEARGLEHKTEAKELHPTIAPSEDNPDDLKRRHEAEQAALKERHDTEAESLRSTQDAGGEDGDVQAASLPGGEVAPSVGTESKPGTEPARRHDLKVGHIPSIADGPSGGVGQASSIADDDWRGPKPRGENQTP